MELYQKLPEEVNEEVEEELIGSPEFSTEKMLKWESSRLWLVSIFEDRFSLSLLS